MLDMIWDRVVRFRTYLIGAIGLVALMLPDLVAIAAQLLNSQQVVDVLPESWRTWAGAIGFVCLVWSRWRPATRAADAEVQVNQALKGTDAPAIVVVESGGETKAVIHG